MHEHDMKREALTVEAAALGVDRELAAYTEGWIRGFAVAGALRSSRPERQRVRPDDAVFNGDLRLRP
jgi:hypothetical protein